MAAETGISWTDSELMKAREWRERFAKELVRLGCDSELAQADADAAECLLDELPEDCAAEEWGLLISDG
jgi:hypothetical protein